MPNLSVPCSIAGFSFYRDLYRFYAAKEELFPERTSGLIFFENMMGIFFTGRNLTDEVLAELRPEVRFVVAEQRFDAAVGTPQVQMPAFAAVLRMRNPEKFGVVFEEAWQKAVGLVNFTRGQQALPGLIIDRPLQGDVKFTVAAFAPPEEKGRSDLPSHHNLSPALALVGEYAVLSSTEGLTRDLIDALKKEGAEPVAACAGLHTMLELRGRELLSILRANRENLIRQNMVEKGSTQEEAEAQIGVLLAALECLEGARLQIGREDGRPRAVLDVRMRMPGGIEASHHAGNEE